jgi:hypothetical protein
MTVHEEQLPPTYEERARKRAQIGLSPARPTARPTFQRPPDETAGRGCLWPLVGLVAVIALATLLLLGARLSGAPTTWPTVQATLQSWWANLTNTRGLVAEIPFSAHPPSRYRLIAEENFTQTTGLLACNQQDGQWDMVYQPEDGIYHIEIAPNRLGWSTLGAMVVRNFRVDLALTIADLRPDGYAGLLARYQNHDNFYLFGIDGRGRYQVQLWQNGQLQTLIPWTENRRLHLAGTANILSVEDDGATLRLAVNDQPLFVVQTPVLPVGDIGVFGAAPAQSNAEVVVDWLKLYAPTEGE